MDWYEDLKSWLNDQASDILPVVQGFADAYQSIAPHTFDTKDLPAFGSGGSSDEANRSIMGNYTPQSVAEEPGFFERITKGAIDGASNAWNKDPLEVMKFGANAIGGYFASERANRQEDARNRQMQAQIDAYNAKLKAEEEKRAAQAAGIAGVRARAPGYRGPLLRNDGTRVFNSDGTVR